MKILFISNIPSPYRIDFFNILGEKCDLTVAFEGKTATDRNSKWKGDAIKTFMPIFMKGIRLRADGFLCIEVVKLLNKNWDAIILGGYSTPTNMLVIEYLRFFRIPFYIEADGGLINRDGFFMYMVKRHFISSASGWFSSGEMTTKYLIHYGAIAQKCYMYPFTSLKEKDFIDAIVIRKKDKDILRTTLEMCEKKIVLLQGYFNCIQDYNVLKKIVENFGKNKEDIGIYIIEDKTEEEFSTWERKYNNIHFVEINSKDQLSKYFAAADLLVLFSNGKDIVNVKNRAMMFGLPIILADTNIINDERIIDNKNVYPVLNDKVEVVLNRVQYFFENEKNIYLVGRENLKKIRKYTIKKQIHENSNFLGKEVRPIIRNCAKNYLKIKEKKMVLAVGQYIHRKGYDLLLQAASELKEDFGFYIVGGEPTVEYINLKNRLKLNNVHFVGFKTKEELADYYRAADIFVHPTREDIWGLVINEAISHFLPVITTDRCVAGIELIKDTVNGKIIKCDDVNAIVNSLQMKFDSLKLVEACLILEDKFSIEKMASRHLKVLTKLVGLY